MFFGQMVRLGGLPFRPSTFPALDEYGVTPAQAEATLAKATEYLERERKAGQLIEFKGKLPRFGFHPRSALLLLALALRLRTGALRGLLVGKLIVVLELFLEAVEFFLQLRDGLLLRGIIVKVV